MLTTAVSGAADDEASCHEAAVSMDGSTGTSVSTITTDGTHRTAHFSPANNEKISEMVERCTKSGLLGMTIDVFVFNGTETHSY